MPTVGKAGQWVLSLPKKAWRGAQWTVGGKKRRMAVAGIGIFGTGMYAGSALRGRVQRTAYGIANESWRRPFPLDAVTSALNTQEPRYRRY